MYTIPPAVQRVGAKSSVLVVLFLHFIFRRSAVSSFQGIIFFFFFHVSCSRPGLGPGRGSMGFNIKPQAATLGTPASNPTPSARIYHRAPRQQRQRQLPAARNKTAVTRTSSSPWPGPGLGPHRPPPLPETARRVPAAFSPAWPYRPSRCRPTPPGRAGKPGAISVAMELVTDRVAKKVIVVERGRGQVPAEGRGRWWGRGWRRLGEREVEKLPLPRLVVVEVAMRSLARVGEAGERWVLI